MSVHQNKELGEKRQEPAVSGRLVDGRRGEGRRTVEESIEAFETEKGLAR